MTLCYRCEHFDRANPTNRADITRAIGEGRILAMLSTEIVELDSDLGRVKVVFSDGFWEIFDQIVYAIGGTTPSAFLQNCAITEEGGIPVHDEHYQTNIPGLFVAGDITQESGGSIALGLNHGHAIAGYITSLL